MQTIITFLTSKPTNCYP